MPKGAAVTRWDRSTDVVVVGLGYAGAVAACAAHDRGAGVVLLEKMPMPGGISICSGGGARVANDAAAALTYLRRTNRDTTPDPVLRILARGMATLPAKFKRLARDVGMDALVTPAPGNYPFPGHQSLGYVSVAPQPDEDLGRLYPWVRGAPDGRRMFLMLDANLRRRGLVPEFSTPVTELVLDRDGIVRGVVARRGRRRIAIAARGGVVLACGGFEAAPAIQRQYWIAQPVLPAAFRGNTGDGLRLAQSAGADLWHMWHYHGSYGFRHTDPKYPFGIRTKPLPDWLPGAGPPADVRMPWILVDRRGRRFMNEYEPYQQDTGARPLDRYLPEAQEFAALPAWMILDARGHSLWPLGRATSNEPGITYDWSLDNETEVKLGILRKAETLADLAREIGVDRNTLELTVATWNDACRSGQDAEWSRPPTSMVPIQQPPYTYAAVWPIVSNTQGGPVHDTRQRVVGADGRPIPGLYVAGEVSSVFGHVYMSGGNVAECFVGGEIAGAEAARRSR